MKAAIRTGLFLRSFYARYSRVCEALFLCFFLGLGLWARCYNRSAVFSGGNIYFADGDCYSRMSRVQMVLAHPFTVIHHQDFENYPQGIHSHATAPFDYLIAGLAVALKPLAAIKAFKWDVVDLAGALVSPLLGLAMIVFLWDWARRLNLPHSGIMLLLVAIDPILIHGTELGRPDHQSLEMLCIVVGLGAEWAFSHKPSRGWGIASGAAWGLGLWVSFYEPLVLLALTLALYLVFDRRKLWIPERRPGLVVFAVFIVLMLFIDGLPFTPPDKILLEYFARWGNTIGELNHGGILGPLEWAGYGLLVSPVLFYFFYGRDKRAVAVMVMLAVVCGLTAWQARWGYFFGIVFAMSLPFLFAPLRKWWIVWSVFLPSLWPVYMELNAMMKPCIELRDIELHGMIQPLSPEAARLRQQLDDTKALRVVAEFLRQGGSGQPVLAPWWYCPELAYWSGQPAVAGTSHESMQGIVDTARFYIATDYEVADKIVRAHSVQWVIAYDPDRVLPDAAKLLNQRYDTRKSLGAVLYRGWHSAPPFLKVVTYNQEFKIFKVMPEEAPR